MKRWNSTVSAVRFCLRSDLIHKPAPFQLFVAHTGGIDTYRNPHSAVVGGRCFKRPDTLTFQLIKSTLGGASTLDLYRYRQQQLAGNAL